ncbi:YbaK/EbsC family protein [Klebsiella pneumoniae]|uniref:YbaK/EbsC family protein n=1 Tax=Klebsiella pneumoniae TaxID=573 RepID=UPI00163A91D2|nr:YbaK/EbsC family protein [Klebsiella pneumoniae]MBK1534859.1 YbaK/prolyl-tRNA synthetase associated domain-containing protein [Klebsiella pneumoniae]HCC2425639.1 YbaK/prolyl-tRNA synthetase associated domain-containing protein [Klebsiella pneumoniae]HDK6016997.1 YbaK/prolyl-tRNA synthetase associated domain-containing protein [Klebsiella pneumoniae]HDY7256282.1 YbaK/prolyl-tRNA synthetase associated domain-containing protein [Klebsiella pneumoniae]HDY9348488.1 YbaK/prolyl-tRNA synthetase as
MLEAVEGNIHQRLCALLDEHRARYRVMAHEAVGQCEAVSAIRGTALGQGAKALVCKVKGNGVNQHVLAILTACVFGAIPPFSFHPALRLVADPLLFERFPQIAFNAGRLDRSIILDTEDYLHIARPEIATFRRLS